jgi:hypothetical protein
VWISGSGNTNKLVRVRPEDGTIQQTLGSPTVLGPSDLDFFGSELWLSTATGDVDSLDVAGQRVTGSLHVFGDVARDHGVAARDGELWVSGLFAGLELHDPATGALIGDVAGTDGVELGALAFVGAELVSVEDRGIVFYDIEPF